MSQTLLLPVTAIYAIVLTLIGSYLAFRAGSMRGRTGISVFYADNPQLMVEMRRHGNFSEFVPLALVLMAIVELNGGSAGLLHGVGILLVVSRICHPIGLEADSVSNPLRGIGAGGTLLASLILIGVMAWQLLA